MHSGLVRWIAYLVLAALVVVTSCRAWTGGPPEVAAAEPVQGSAVQGGAAHGEATG